MKNKRQARARIGAAKRTVKTKNGRGSVKDNEAPTSSSSLGKDVQEVLDRNIRRILDSNVSATPLTAEAVRLALRRAYSIETPVEIVRERMAALGKAVSFQVKATERGSAAVHVQRIGTASAESSAEAGRLATAELPPLQAVASAAGGKQSASATAVAEHWAGAGVCEDAEQSTVAGLIQRAAKAESSDGAAQLATFADLLKGNPRLQELCMAMRDVSAAIDVLVRLEIKGQRQTLAPIEEWLLRYWRIVAGEGYEASLQMVMGLLYGLGAVLQHHAETEDVFVVLGRASDGWEGLMDFCKMVEDR